MKIFSYRYLPLNIYIGYSCFVILSLTLGPIEYKDLDYFVLIPFITILVLLFAFGFILGARGEYRIDSFNLDVRSISAQRVSFFISTLLFFAVITSIAHWYSFLALGGKLNLGDIGANYVKGYEGYERGQARVDIFYILNIFGQALITLALLFSIYYYRTMGLLAKSAFCFILITFILVNVVGSGKQKYLGDIVIFTFFCMLINFAAKGRKLNFRTFCVFGLIGLCVFFLFLEILRQRYLAAGIGLDNIHLKTHPLIEWDESSLFFNLIGSEYTLALGIFLGYFSNGLYGLYLSLNLPFEWSYFVGNSYSIGRIVEIGLSTDGFVLEQTYPYRVGEVYGWGFDKWHSLFAWLASDITFIGVLFLTPIFSFLYARLWLQAIKASNPFAGPLFIYFSMGLIFSYANNQLMHGLAGVMVLLVLFVGWFFSRNLSFHNFLPGKALCQREE
ncbi:hypothetical protein ACJJIP_04985 [Microbulbifer sp. VTAC004]|uniref:hypothetical protein n=1 Tax=unclassified Microbulbifer TaxID=2619833 RepID=UPI00403A4ED2